MEFNPIFDDIELNKIDKNFIVIDNETKIEIYNKHLSPNKLCNNLLINLKSQKSCNLDISDIVPILRIILDDKESINYLYNNYYHIDNYTKKKINYFKDLYNKIIKNTDKNFTLIKDPVEDFALSWLMYLYH
jgi:hypothetical protein